MLKNKYYQSAVPMLNAVGDVTIDENLVEQTSHIMAGVCGGRPFWLIEMSGLIGD